MYRTDFAAADSKVATVTDPSGRTAALLSLTGALLLLPVSLAPCVAGAVDGATALLSFCPARRTWPAPSLSFAAPATPRAAAAARLPGLSPARIPSRAGDRTAKIVTLVLAVTLILEVIRAFTIGGL